MRIGDTPGQEAGRHLTEGLPNLGFDDLRRLRSDKVIPRTFGSEIGRASLKMGAPTKRSYQPEVAFGV